VAAAAILVCAQPKRKSAPEKLTIDVTVTDASGNGIPGLGSDDFEVELAGKPVRITKSDYLGKPVSTEGAALTIWPRIQAGEDHRSVTVFVIDDLALSGAARSSVKDAIGRFVDDKMEPGDLAAIITTRTGKGELQELTSDKKALHEAIAAVAPNPAEAPPASLAYNDALAGLTASILRPIFDELRDVTGSKAVILFSQNMQLFGSPAIDVKTLEGRANRASASFYTVDPRGLVNAPASGLTLDQIPFSGGLGALARNTGGIFFDNTNDAARVLARYCQTRTGYYRVAFSGDLEANSFTLVFGKVSVRVKRPGANVYTRTEYPRSSESGYMELPENPFGFQLPGPPLSSGGLRLRFTPLVSNTSKHAIDALVAVDVRGISFTTGANGIDTGNVEVGSVAWSGGEIVGRESRAYTMQLPHARLEEMHENLTATIHLGVSGSGPMEVEAVVRDVTSGKTGQAREFLKMPDVTNGALALSGIFLESAVSQGGRPAPGENAAVRQFHPGSKMVFSYAVFNAKYDEEKKAHADIQVRIYREGEALLSNMQPDVRLGPPAEPGRWPRTGSLELKEAAKPGKYSLELTVIDRAVKTDPPPAATQTIDFEVR